LFSFYSLRKKLFGGKAKPKLKPAVARRSPLILALEQVLGFAPLRVELYEQAFTHSSMTREYYRRHRPAEDAAKCHNERLEFLGDAVIEVVVSDYLYNKFPDRREGFLTQLRSKIVGHSALDQLARKLNLLNLVKVLPGNATKNLGGDVLEALVGAIYLDQGYECVRDVFVNRLLLPHVDVDKLLRQEFDYKSRLLELVQKRGRQAVFNVEMLQSKARGAAPKFCCTLHIDDNVAGTGEGTSKKEAEQRAAEQAFNRLSVQHR
jgi:ribonuclease-3